MDDDYALALQLQSEFFDDSENDLQKEIGIGNKYFKSGEPKSLVDPFWELTDPNPDIRALFLQFNDRFFWGRLAGIEIRWSPRMTLCAGLCCYEGRGGLCSVRLSVPLLKLRPRKDLVETLLHEMIHAYLFVTDNNKDHDGHGPEFHKHMYRINKEAGTSISVYHNFHDEVNLYKQHWWRCDGPCQSRKPYFGYVKRSMNRAPSKNDTWWAEHQRTCGGTYTKVKEPENYGKKKGNPKNEDDKKKEKGKSSVKSMDIRIFAGEGKTLGGNKVDTVSATKSIADDYLTATPKPSTSQIVAADKSSNSTTSRFVSEDVPGNGSPSQENALPGGKTPQKNPMFKNIPVSQGGNARFNEKRKSAHVFNIPDFSDSNDEDEDLMASIPLDNLSADSIDSRDSDHFSDKEYISKSNTNDYCSTLISEMEANEKENKSSQKINSQFAQDGHGVDSSCSSEADDVRAMLRKVWGQKQFDNKVSGSKIAKGKTTLPLNSFNSSESLVGKVKAIGSNTDRKYPGADRNSVISSNKRISDTSLDTTPPVKRPRSDDDKTLATGASENTVKVKNKTLVTSPIDKYFSKFPAVSSAAANLPETRTSYGTSQCVDNAVEGDNSGDTKTNGKVETSACPICNTPVPVSTINDHLDLCLTLQAI